MRRAATLLALLLAACGGRGDPGQPAPPPPVDVTGATIMLLPVQAPSPPGLDAEIAFWMQQRAPGTRWLLPADLQRVLDRSPAWPVRLDALPGGVSDQGGRRRVHDPLYGHLRRLGAQVDAQLALLPLARPVPDSAGTATEMSAILIQLSGGQVVWMGTVRVPPAADGAAASPAAVAEALARTLLL